MIERNGTPHGWLCPKCSRVYAPGMPECRPCNRPIERAADEMSWAIRFDFPGQDEALFAGMYHDALGWTHELTTAVRYESPEVAAKTLEYGFGPEARRHGRVVGIREKEAR